jgi:hypothetical protein
MIRELRLYFRMRPYIGQLQEVLKVNKKLTWAVTVQIALILTNALQAMTTYVPEGLKPVLFSVLILCQATHAIGLLFVAPPGMVSVPENHPAAEQFLTGLPPVHPIPQPTMKGASRT